METESIEVVDLDLTLILRSGKMNITSLQNLSKEISSMLIESGVDIIVTGTDLSVRTVPEHRLSIFKATYRSRK